MTRADRRRHGRAISYQYIKDYKEREDIVCVKCFESRAEFLTFHHVDQSNKVDTISSLAARASIVKVKKEMAKCIVLCEECHKKEHEVPKKTKEEKKIIGKCRQYDMFGVECCV